MNILDLFFPKRCVSCKRVGSYICSDCFSKIEFVKHPICPVCQRQAVGGKTHPGCVGRYRLDGLVVACRYSGPVKMAIGKVKYKWIYDIGKVLCELIVKNLWRFDIETNLTLVPVPLHSKRKRSRGFNQAEILAQDLAKRFGEKYEDLLVRNVETKSQVGLKRDARFENIKDAFSLKNSSDLRGKNFIIVDDVYTSGATISECAKVLKRAGAKSVWAMTVALG